MAKDNDNGAFQNHKPGDLIKHAWNGEHEAFVELLVEHGYKDIIYAVIQELTSQPSAQETREALFRKLVEDVYRALPEFRPDEEDFGDWLHQAAKKNLVAERIKIIRAKKGDRDAFRDLITEYKDVIHRVVQEYAPHISEYNEQELFEAIEEDAYRSVWEFRIYEDGFGNWLQHATTEICGFIFSKEQFKNGNQEVFDEVFRQYYTHFIPQVIQRQFPRMQDQDKEEIVQNVTVRAYEKIAEFRGNVNSFKYWLRRTAGGLCLNMVNFQAKGEEFPDTKGVQDDQDTSFQVREELNLVLNAIELLSEEYQEVVHLRHRQELQYKEIAKVLHIEIGTVKSRLSEARKLLKRIRKLVEEWGVSLQQIKKRLRELSERDKKAKLPKVLDELEKECSLTR
jgi:RNA polymerase sigma-70 factor (ECF subfamily)